MSDNKKEQNKFKLLRGRRKGQFAKKKVVFGRENNAAKVKEYWENFRSSQPTPASKKQVNNFSELQKCV